LVLIARGSKHNAICNLALDRLKSVKPTKEAFIENDLFEINTYFNNLIGVTFPLGEVVSDIVLKVSPSQVPYVKTKPIHFTQQTEATLSDGSMVVKLKLKKGAHLEQYIKVPKLLKCRP
jgi:hypothetical protein